MPLADRPSSSEDLRCGHPPSFWSDALDRFRTRYPKPNHGDKPDGRPPYAVIHVQLFKPDSDQSDQAHDGSGFDQETYSRIEEQIERVIRVNRNTHLSSLIDMGFPITCGAFFAFGWSCGLAAAFIIVDVLRKFDPSL